MIIRLNMMDIVDDQLVEGAQDFIFMDNEQFIANKGYMAFANPNCYEKAVNDGYVFNLNSFSGIFGNLPFESYVEKGVGDIGNDWKGNSIGTRVITLSFDNVFSYIDRDVFKSPNELLNDYIYNSGQYVLFEIMLDEIIRWSLVMRFTPDTNTENNVIVLETALSNDGTLWKGEGSKIYNGQFEQKEVNKDIILKLEALKDSTPLYLEVVKGTATIRLNDTNYLSLSGFDGERLIFDTENGTITNELGVDQRGEITDHIGDGNLFLNKGINELIIHYVPNQTVAGIGLYNYIDTFNGTKRSLSYE